MTDPDRSGGDQRDLELIAAWKAGDQRAATELVGRHATALARFAASCGARDEIDELVQDTFVKAFASLDGFRGESGFRTWLFTIERRLLIDRLRAERRRPQSAELQDDSASTAHSALDNLVGRSSAEGETGVGSLDTNATRRVRAKGDRGAFVQGNRGCGGFDRGCGAGSLPQCDARGKGVAR